MTFQSVVQVIFRAVNASVGTRETVHLAIVQAL